MKNIILISISLVLALIFIVIGFLFDVKDYSINILAELAGLFIGIIVAILLVDRLTENQRKKRWARVRELTHRTIAHHLSNIILELFNHFPLPDQQIVATIVKNRDKPSSQIINTLNIIIEQIKHLLQENKISNLSAIDYYNAIKWDVSQIRLDLIPRVMQSSEDQNLIDALVEFDDTTQDVQTAVVTQKQFTNSNILYHIIPLLETIRNIYKYL